MTTSELHEILDDENKKISIQEYQNILYNLKSDTFYERTKNVDMSSGEYQWYLGEANGFQIALDLSEHIEDKCIAELEKALELACEDYLEYQQDLINDCVIEGMILSNKGFDDTLKYLVSNFKEQAKKEIENE